MRTKASHEERTRSLLAGLPVELREGLSHLLACPVCQGLAREALRERGARAEERRLTDVRSVLCWLEMAAPGLIASLEERAAEAERLLEELLHQPVGERLSLLGQHGFRNLCLADLLLDASGEATREDPVRAEELARLALAIAGQAQPKEDLAWSEDVKVRGYCLMGNARRLLRDPRGAEEAFRSAAYHLTQPPDSGERAFYCRMVALLRQEQGRMDEAVGLYWRAAGIFRETGELLAEGECLAELGGLFVEEGEHDRAIHPLARAAELVNGERTPGLVARVRLGLALCHAALGHRNLALREEEAAQPFYRGVTDEDERGALCALRGRIAALTNQVEEGVGLLEAARLCFLATGRLHQAALATLDLILLWDGERRLERLQEMTRELSDACGRTPQREGVLSALQGFAREVARGPEVQLGEAAAQAAEELRRFRRNPLLALEALARRQDETSTER